MDFNCRPIPKLETEEESVQVTDSDGLSIGRSYFQSIKILIQLWGFPYLHS